ncbi:MAG: hypothetical protein K0M63_10350 [Weeksellaceae bacterium]|nr:hypothetical protein [Weeksellaceae bacterium]
MRAYFLKRETVIRLLSLVSITASVFLQDIALKIGLLGLGILGLMALAYFKKQKITLIVYAILLIAGGVGYYLLVKDIVHLPQQ